METWVNADEASTATVLVGVPVRLEVTEIGSTGLSWNLEGLPPSHYSSIFVPGGFVPGQAGRRIFRFVLDTPGPKNIVLILRAPWERDAVEVKHVLFTVLENECDP